MIYTECKPDTLLVKTVTKARRKEIDHQPNKFEVCKKLARLTNSIGLIDEDPTERPPRYLAGLNQEDDLSDHNIKVMYDRTRRNRLIVLCPMLEQWILEAATRSGIDVQKRYSLPGDAGHLHEIINANLDKFEKLLKDLKRSDRLKALARVLENK